MFLPYEGHVDYFSRTSASNTMGTMLRYLLFFAPAALLVGQNPPSPAGDWVSNLRYFGNDNYDRLHLELNAGKLVGKLGDDAFNGTFTSGRVEGTVKPDPKETIKLTGLLTGDRIEGTAHIVEEHLDLKWEAYRQTPKRTGPPKRHVFEPTEFQHHFSDDIKPVLHLNAGDSVWTWSVDAGGTDAKGVRRTSGGNPLTGPFYIEGTVPGDTLVVHFTRIRLNRNTAISSPLIVNNALEPDYVEGRKKVENYDADWKLDLKSGFASLQKATEIMKNYKVPLAPMLGCVGVAPGDGNRYRSGYLGGFGGNLDYNQLREGVTVYLPVNVPGALLFVGDGHAVQGAGELTGNALETSMDFEFSVGYLPGGAPSNPRLENDNYLMASGIAGSLDDAFRAATTNLVRWLEKTYKLNAAEASSVVSTSVVYDVAEVVDPQVHVVARVPKSALSSFKRK
jgi:acetamidase/formamidase